MAAIEFEIFGLTIMADLFLELFSEEIPARLQYVAQENIKRLVVEELLLAKSNFEAVESFSTPRRLILIIKGLSEKTRPDIEEKRGPNVLAPKAAIEGFCKSIKIERSQLFTRDEKKGQFYYARLKPTGQLNSDLVPEILSKVIKGFPWPKSMRWGSGNFRWVRPLRSIVCILYDDTESKVLPLEFDGIKSGNVSEGHRFLSPNKFKVSSFEDYQEKIRLGYVILDRAVRKKTIRHEASNIAFAVGRELIEDEKLLDEVVGLVEWPVTHMGKIDKDFLALPPEVLQVSMREHQKFFSLRHKETKSIDSFIMVSNIITEDNGISVIKGNERVLRARLSDAKFFWENDLRLIELDGYESFFEKLKKVTFHNKLGSESERIDRISHIALKIAGIIRADLNSTRTASSLCKLDLVSEMVCEFPELQGVIGKYYAKKAGFNDLISDACFEHYLPKGPFDPVPQRPVSISLALAEKIDMICSFWSINLKPTGSKDPYALRRSAIGIIRILLENDLDLSIVELLRLGNNNLDFEDLLDFFNERIKVQLHEKGIKPDVLNSVSTKNYHDLSLKEMSHRAWAIQEFVANESGKDLIQGYKRALNILTAEEKKDGVEYSLDTKKELLSEVPEVALHAQLQGIDKKVIYDLEKAEPKSALLKLATLRQSIDKFFNEVQINSENSIIRRNRLCLLNKIKEVMHLVADFSKIDGDV